MSRGAGAGSVTHSWTFGDGTPGSAVQWVAIGVDVMAADAGDPAPSIGSSGVISRQFDGKCRPRQFAPGLAR